MARRRKRSTGPPKCRECGRLVVWFRSPFKSGWRTFEPRPIDPRTAHPAAYPIDAGVQAWKFADLVEELMGRYACGRGEAQDHAYAMPWHVLHDCAGTARRPPSPIDPED